jgi:hypothetical protein
VLLNNAHVVAGHSSGLLESPRPPVSLCHLHPYSLSCEITRYLRDLTTMRASLSQEASRISSRIQKVLVDANVKLGSMATKVLGKSGRAMLEDIIAGEDDPERLAALAPGHLRVKIPQLRLALAGKIRSHHRFLLRRLVDPIQFVENEVALLDERLENVGRQRPDLAQAVVRWDTIPGVDRVAAWALLAEIGDNLAQFPTAEHLASWAAPSLVPKISKSPPRSFWSGSATGLRSKISPVRSAGSDLGNRFRLRFLTVVSFPFAENPRFIVQEGDREGTDRKGNGTAGDYQLQALREPMPVIEKTIETAALMLGSDRSRGYCLEMICADFLAGANLDSGDPETLLFSVTRFFKFLPAEHNQKFLEGLNEKAS